MVALSSHKSDTQVSPTESQERVPAVAPSLDRQDIFERLRTASENLPPNHSPSQSHTQSTSESPVSQERALKVENRAQELYRAMRGGLTGWGTDEEQVLTALKGLSPAETQLLKEVYANRFNTKLENDLAAELSGHHLEQAHAALRGDRMLETATALHRAMDGAGTDEEAIVEALSSLKPEEHEKVAQAYQKAYGVAFDAALARELSGDDLTRVRALRMGQSSTAAAAELHKAMAGVGTDEAAVLGVMKRHSPEHMKAIAGEYQRLYGVSLDQSIQTELSGHQQSEARALAAGDRTGAKVAQLRGALEGAGTSETIIFEVLEGTSAQEREAIRSAYKMQTGTSLEDTLRSDLSGADLERANILLAHGKLSDIERLRFAFEGAGTDEATIKEVLRNRSKGEIEALKNEYQARYHESLESRINGELGGSDEFRALQALKGRPSTVEEALQNMQELDAFERSGILSDVIGAFSNEDDRIQEQLALAKFDIYAAQKNGVITPEERASIERTLRFAEGNIDVHVETRDAVANTGATVAAVAGSTIVVVGTGGIATPGVIAAAAAVGGASYAGTKYVVQGKGYDGENIASDVGIGAVEGAVTALTAGTATALKSAAQQGAKQVVTTGSHAAVRETVVESVGATVQDAISPDTWAGGVAAGVANLAVSAAGTAIASGALHRAAEGRPPRMRDEVVSSTSHTSHPDTPLTVPTQMASVHGGGQVSSAQEPFVALRETSRNRQDSPSIAAVGSPRDPFSRELTTGAVETSSAAFVRNAAPSWRIVEPTINPFVGIQSVNELGLRAGIERWVSYDSDIKRVQEFLREHSTSPANRLALARVIASESPGVGSDILPALGIIEQRDIFDVAMSALRGNPREFHLNDFRKAGLNDPGALYALQERLDSQKKWVHFPLSYFDESHGFPAVTTSSPTRVVDLSTILNRNGIDSETGVQIIGESVEAYSARGADRGHIFLGSVERSGVNYQVVAPNVESLLNDFKYKVFQKGSGSTELGEIVRAADRKYFFGSFSDRLPSHQLFQSTEGGADESLSIVLRTGSNLPIKKIRVDANARNGTSWGCGTYLAPDISKGYAVSAGADGFLMTVQVRMRASEILDAYQPIGPGLAKHLSELSGHSVDAFSRYCDLRLQGHASPWLERALDDAGVKAVYVPLHALVVRDAECMQVLQVSRYLHSVAGRVQNSTLPQNASLAHSSLVRSSLEPRRAALEAAGLSTTGLDHRSVLRLYDAPETQRAIQANRKLQLHQLKLKGSEESISDFIDAARRVVDSIERGTLPVRLPYPEIFERFKRDLIELESASPTSECPTLFDDCLPGIVSSLREVMRPNAYGSMSLEPQAVVSLLRDVSTIENLRGDGWYNGFYINYWDLLKVPPVLTPAQVDLICCPEELVVDGYLKLKGYDPQDIYVEAYPSTVSEQELID
jgi:hypothetical protein